MMHQRGMIAIDMILDTRYGTLKMMDPVLAEVIAASDAYRLRYHDNFSALNEEVDQARYDELYRNRDGDTLYHSDMTDFVYMLRRDARAAIPQMARGVWFNELSFDINVWPYDLSAGEMETIRRAVARYIPTPAKVGVVNIAPEVMTPEYVKNHYEMMAWYNHEDWLGPNQDKLIAHPLPNHVLLTPMIASSGVVPEATNEIRDPFKAREAILVQFIALNYLPVPFVCTNPAILQELRNPSH